MKALSLVNNARPRSAAWSVGTVVFALLLGINLIACKPKSTVPAPSLPVDVVVTRLQTTRIKDVVQLDGNVSPVQQVNLVARVAGNLEAVHFKDGDVVKAGQLLFTIEQPPYQDQLKLNLARLEQYQADYTRQSQLLKENANSQANVESSLSNLQQAQANVRIAQTNLDYTLVRAPFNGIMSKRQVDPGNYVGAAAGGTVLATIMQISPAYVYAAIGETEVLRLRSQRPTVSNGTAPRPKPVVHAQLQGETAPSAHGTLDYVDHQLNQTSGTVQVRGVFPNTDRHLLPGFYAKLTIEAGGERDALVLPRAVLQSDQQGEYVFVVDAQNIAKRRAVSTTSLPGESKEVRSGLAPGDQVVTQGFTKIADGQRVNIASVMENPATSQAASASASAAKGAP